MVIVDNNTQPKISTSPEAPLQQTELPSQSHSLTWIVWILLAAILVVGVTILFIFLNKSPSPTPISSTTPNATPTPKVMDLAPSIAANLKTILLIQNSDSSLEKIIIPTQQVDAYIQNLPEGERFISKSPDQ